MFDLKMYREVIFNDTEGDAKFEEKMTWALENDKNMAILTRAIEILKIGILMWSFNPK